MIDENCGVKIMKRIRLENLWFSRAIYMKNCIMINEAKRLHWKNAKIMKALGKLMATTEKFYVEWVNTYLPEFITRSKKLNWREKRDRTKKENNRHTVAPGNLRWRKEGFRKQGVETEVPNGSERLRQNHMGTAQKRTDDDWSEAF